MAGSCESIVENTKRCLTFITKDRPISEEALVTFLTEVDATLNSRPLTQILMDISYFNILILVHFIFTKQSLFFFFYLGFLSRIFTIHMTSGEFT